jgi:pyruvate dehydrogenase E2 component (dihydrolipoamide acetyltransferase)
MATDVIMPALGVAQEKGTLLNWFKSEGESVRKGEPLMEVETDKATVEIEAPASGVLTDVTASPGDEVPVGNKIAVILAPDEEAEPAAKRKLSHPSLLSEGQKIERGTPGGQSESRDEDRRETSTSALPAEPAPSHAGERIPASPAARRVARERGIDLASLKGSGPGGAVLAQDVLGSKARQVTAPAGPPSVKELVQLTPMRRLVGERMARSKQSAPHFYLSIEVDMAEITRQRNALKEREVPLAPSINDFILIACARALRQFPSLNAAFTEQGIQGYSDINIGMAVALEEGLVVPVIRNADRLSLAELAQQSRDLAEKAQNRKLFPLDYEGGTFTVSNLGMFGIDNFIAIINPPQCAILAVGQVAPRVVPHGEGIAVRPRMTMSLSADHRVVDGALAARFLQEIKRTLETGKF